ncbi:MAG TPA: hypothetical protein VGH92_13385, partial [Gaiellaceae bacterium]
MLLFVVVVVAATAAAIPAAFADQPSVVVADAGTSSKGEVGSAVDAVAGSTVLTGTRGYFPQIRNETASTVTNASMTLTSGWALSSFPGLASLPATSTPTSLAPGESTGYLDFNQLCCTVVPATFAEGFDSARTMQPLVIGPSGGLQTVQVSLTITDAALASNIFDLSVSVGDPTWLLPGGVTLVSSSGPTNLDSGEGLSSPTAPGLNSDWALFSPKLGKTYMFTYTLDVTNPFGVPIDFKPPIHIVAGPEGSSTMSGLSNSVTAAIPSLDGPSGSGAATFSVDQP